MSRPSAAIPVKPVRTLHKCSATPFRRPSIPTTASSRSLGTGPVEVNFPLRLACTHVSQAEEIFRADDCQDGGRSLGAYMTLPVEQYALLELPLGAKLRKQNLSDDPSAFVLTVEKMEVRQLGG